MNKYLITVKESLPMARIHRWDVEGKWFEEITIGDDEAVDVEGEPLPTKAEEVLCRLPHRGDCELVIEFRSVGYSDPGQTYGDPSGCYPPEGSDERSLVRAYIRIDGKDHTIPQDAARVLFDVFESRIVEVVLEGAEEDDRW